MRNAVKKEGGGLGDADGKKASAGPPDGQTFSGGHQTEHSGCSESGLGRFLSCTVLVLVEPSTHLPISGTRSLDLNPVTGVEGPEPDPDPPFPPEVLQRRLGELPKSRSADPVPQYTPRLEVVRLKHSFSSLCLQKREM